jgi:Abnormal spindle-like microcephaly-assoc'd, ASPM-SPD-2-Hydin
MATPSVLSNGTSFAKVSSSAPTTFTKTPQRRVPSKIAGHALVIILLVIVLGAALPIWATTYTVTSTTDSGTGSLRAALGVASNGDMINFNLTYPATITLTSGSLEIATNVIIKGPGATKLFISGNNTSTVFQVDSTVTGLGTTISGVTIENGFNQNSGGGIYNEGRLTVSDSTISGNFVQPTFHYQTVSACGGGIYSAGILTVRHSTVAGNSAVGESTAAGGGICSEGTLTVSNTSFSDNSAEGISNGAYGGGISGGTVMVIDSTFSGNSVGGEVGGNGGGISGGTVTVINSTFFRNYLGNDGGFGGGIDGDTLTVINSTFAGNSAGIFGYGGGIDGDTLMVINSTFSGNSAGNGGGGISNGGASTVINSTFSGNSQSTSGGPTYFGGGGILNGGTLAVSFSTFFSNSAGSYGGGILNRGALTLKGTLLANELAGGGNCYVASGTATSDGYNLSDDNSCSFLTAPGDQNDVATAGLSPSSLQDNGGPTETITLLSTSRAVNAIPVTPINECTDAFGSPVTTDQRGVSRPQGSGCDMGAYELSQAQVTGFPTAVSLGNIEVCQTKKEVVTLHNNGSTKVQIGSISFIDVSGNPGDFQEIDYCEATLAPGKSCTLGVKFRPSEEAPESATLNIVTNAPGSPLQVPITGTGIAAANCIFLQ